MREKTVKTEAKADWSPATGACPVCGWDGIDWEEAVSLKGRRLTATADCSECGSQITLHYVYAWAQIEEPDPIDEDRCACGTVLSAGRSMCGICEAEHREAMAELAYERQRDGE